MKIFGEQMSHEEDRVARLLISVISIYGNDGLPLDLVDEEFVRYCGFSIPWKEFGARTLKSWIDSLPFIYIVKNDLNDDVLIEQSPKSGHIREGRVQSTRDFVDNGIKRKHVREHDDQEDEGPYKMKKRLEIANLPEGSFLHTSINNVSGTDNDRIEKFQQLVIMG